MIIVGGLGSILGSVVGAAVITTLNDSLAGFQSYRPLIFGAILITSMLFMPGGIASALGKLPLDKETIDDQPCRPACCS